MNLACSDSISEPVVVPTFSPVKGEASVFQREDAEKCFFKERGDLVSVCEKFGVDAVNDHELAQQDRLRLIDWVARLEYNLRSSKFEAAQLKQRCSELETGMAAVTCSKDHALQQAGLAQAREAESKAETEQRNRIIQTLSSRTCDEQLKAKRCEETLNVRSLELSQSHSQILEARNENEASRETLERLQSRARTLLDDHQIQTLRNDLRDTRIEIIKRGGDLDNLENSYKKLHWQAGRDVQLAGEELREARAEGVKFQAELGGMESLARKNSVDHTKKIEAARREVREAVAESGSRLLALESLERENRRLQEDNIMLKATHDARIRAGQARSHLDEINSHDCAMQARDLEDVLRSELSEARKEIEENSLASQTQLIEHQARLASQDKELRQVQSESETRYRALEALENSQSDHTVQALVKQMQQARAESEASGDAYSELEAELYRLQEDQKCQCTALRVADRRSSMFESRCQGLEDALVAESARHKSFVHETEDSRARCERLEEANHLLRMDFQETMNRTAPYYAISSPSNGLAANDNWRENSTGSPAFRKPSLASTPSTTATGSSRPYSLVSLNSFGSSPLSAPLTPLSAKFRNPSAGIAASAGRTVEPVSPPAGSSSSSWSGAGKEVLPPCSPKKRLFGGRLPMEVLGSRPDAMDASGFAHADALHIASPPPPRIS